MVLKEVFSYNSDINKTAYLNWRTSVYEPIYNMQVLADGYFQAAIELSKYCLNNNSDTKADVIIFPMIFSLNHGIELYVKSIRWSMYILLDIDKSYKNNHNIKKIWNDVKEKIKQFGFDEIAGRGEEEFYSMIVILEKYIDELYEKIYKCDKNGDVFHNIDFSRYPISNKDIPHFYIYNVENVVVDLENFIFVTRDIYECLKRLSEYYYGLVEGKLKKNID